MVKMPMSIPVQNFPHDQNPGEMPVVHRSVHHTDSPSVNSSPSAANLSKKPVIMGRKMW